MNLSDLTIPDRDKTTLDQIFFSNENEAALQQVIKEHKYLEELTKLNLQVNNKILLHGASGCGKTTTAKAIARSLNKDILIVNLSTVINSRIGETSKNIKALFDKAICENAILFLDQFDLIGKSRQSNDKDVGEMRRLVNTIIQLIDYLPTESILICATNYRSVIDLALLRRFQLQLKFYLPEKKQLDRYYDKILAGFPSHLDTIPRRYKISYAQAKDDIQNKMKKLLIEALDTSSPILECSPMEHENLLRQTESFIDKNHQVFVKIDPY